MKNTLFVELFYDLLAERGINRSQFSEQSGIPYPTVVGWTSHGRLPDFSALMKIADFFDCSADYLMGRQDEFSRSIYSNKLTEEERALLKTYRKMDDENKTLITAISQKLAKK